MMKERREEEWSEPVAVISSRPRIRVPVTSSLHSPPTPAVSLSLRLCGSLRWTLFAGRQLLAVI